MEETAIERRRRLQRENYQKNKETINQKRRLRYLAKTMKTPEREWKFNTYEDVFHGLTDKHKESRKYHLLNVFKILETDNFEKTIQNGEQVITKYRNVELPINSKKTYFETLLIAKTDNNIEIPEFTNKLYLTYLEELKLDSLDATKKKQQNETIPEFTKLLELVKTKFGDNSKEYLLIKLYEENTARDNYYLQLVRNENQATDINTNYLVIPINVKQVCKIVLNTFKTRGDKYPVVNVKLSQELSTGLRRYKNITRLDYGDYIFNKSNGELIKRIFSKVGINGTINTLRQMNASKSIGLTNKEKSEIAHKMNHSINSQKHYLRTFTTDTN